MKKTRSFNFIIAAGLCLLLSGKVLAQTTNAAFINNQSKMLKPTNMKEYILLVQLPLSYGAEQAKEVREQWTQLLAKWKADSIFVTSFVFPNEGYVIKNAEKIVKKETVVSDNRKLISTIILRAVSMEAAIELAKAAPVLSQDGIVEVREIQQRPVPGDKK